MGEYDHQEKTDKGFWNGDADSPGSNGESGGHSSGYPGRGKPSQLGVRVDLDGEGATAPGASAFDDGAD